VVALATIVVLALRILALVVPPGLLATPGACLLVVNDGEEQAKQRYGAEELHDAAPCAGRGQGSRERIELTTVHLDPSSTQDRRARFIPASGSFARSGAGCGA
jgi:hypothetical protein